MRHETPEEIAAKLYLKGEYVARNPSLHEEDSAWKLSKILPLVDEFARRSDRSEVKLLDIGGGAGLILAGVADHLSRRHGLQVEKHALDLSSEMLDAQRGTNPDLRRALREDIRATSIGEKEFDLVMMIDVLEHIPTPEVALAQVRRISRFAIYKVPLERNLLYRVLNFLKKGGIRSGAADAVGHLTAYDAKTLRGQMEAYGGSIVRFTYTNVYEYYLDTAQRQAGLGRRDRLTNAAGRQLFRLSPSLAAFLFLDFAILLVESS